MLYHLMPDRVVGDALLPLNRLAPIDHEEAGRHRAKYVGREALLGRRVLPLDGSWLDVIHLSPVHLEEVRDALLAAGHRWRDGGRRVAAIDPEAVGMTAQNTALWLSPPGARVRLLGTPDEYAPFGPDALDDHRVLPEQTREHYAEFAALGRPAFLFHGITHVLHRGAIPLGTVEVIVV